MSVALQAQRDSKVTVDLNSLSERISLCADMQKEADSNDEVSTEGGAGAGPHENRHWCHLNDPISYYLLSLTHAQQFKT